MRDQRLAGLAAVAVDDVEHAGRNARLERQLAEARRGQRRQLAHLQHRGVAEGQAGSDLPGRGHERHVPGRDQGADADRMEQGVVEVGRGRVGVAVDPHAHLGEVVEVVGGAGDQLLSGLGDHLAGVAGLGLREGRHVGGDQVAQAPHQAGPLDRGRARPLRERRLGRGDRRLHLRGAPARHLGEHLLGGRIDGLEVVAAGDRTAVDQVLDAHALNLVAVSVRIRRRRRWC